ncbi:unnamed protein product [Trichobilharzia regenti]|nr:unnamed protein product [Trichobilharzia regenti]
MEPDTVVEVLRYINTGQVVGIDQLAHELLATPDKYQLERLKTMCEEALVECPSVENACDIFGLADMHNAEQLKAHTLEFIMLHAHDICETEGYEQLVRHRPRLLNECFRSLASQQLPLRCWARKVLGNLKFFNEIGVTGVHDDDEEEDDSDDCDTAIVTLATE